MFLHLTTIPMFIFIYHSLVTSVPMHNNIDKIMSAPRKDRDQSGHLSSQVHLCHLLVNTLGLKKNVHQVDSDRLEVSCYFAGCRGVVTRCCWFSDEVFNFSLVDSRKFPTVTVKRRKIQVF